MSKPVAQKSEQKTTLNKDDMKTVDRFSYLGDFTRSEREVQKAVSSRKRTDWKKNSRIYPAFCARKVCH